MSLQLKARGPNVASQVILCDLWEPPRCMTVSTQFPLITPKAYAVHSQGHVEAAAYFLTPKAFLSAADQIAARAETVWTILPAAIDVVASSVKGLQ